MSAGRLTTGQRKLIDRLRTDHAELSKAVKAFLAREGKDTVGDLSIDEASRLIEGLQKIRREKNIPDIIHVSKKQVALIRSLQDGEERIRITQKFLKERALSDPEELALHDASLLIDSLLAAKAGTKEERMQSPITLKQLHFISSLLSSGKKSEIFSRYMKSVKKKTPEELSRSEARNLIDILLETR